ncbi:MAG: mandelate racemase/muconate lactonizing enzyme family protein [Planctomycetes bacterium]|nr:mandelate racemase/muconate lactonizing enzyme family protein [Planctomycetota bacterium]
MLIESIECLHLQVPFRHEGRISLRNTLTLPGFFNFLAVRVRTDAGLDGIGFTRAAIGGEALASLIRGPLAEVVLKENPLEHDRLFHRAEKRFHGVGFQGLAARAYAAIDIALWDLKGKIADLPLYRLLGSSRSHASVYLGNAATTGKDPQETLAIAKPLIEQGVLGLNIEVGGDNIQHDADRVQQIRDGLGEDAWLSIDAQGRYDLGTALAMAHFYEEDVGIDRYEFPIPAEDAKGYQRLAERMEVPLALGNTFDRRDEFRQVLESGWVRVLRPDVLRLGGITPFVKIATLAEAYAAVVSPVRLPEIAVHLACGLSNINAVEFSNVLEPLFAEPVRIDKGKLTPSARPGHGLEFNPEALERYGV